MEKNADFKFNVSTIAPQYTGSNVRFSTQDEGTAVLTFFLTKDGMVLPLTGAIGKIVMKMADGSTFVDTINIIHEEKGIAEYKLTNEQIKHYGMVIAELYLSYDASSNMSVHRFNFTIEQALIDCDILIIKEYYVDDFEALKVAINLMADETKDIINVVSSNVDQAKDLAEEIISQIENNQTVKAIDYNLNKTNVQQQLDDKAEQTYVDLALSSVTKGGPKEIFYSLNALKTKYPSGATVTVLVYDSSFTNGPHSFLWDGTAWKDLGVYQGTGIPENSVGYEELSPELSGINDYTTVPIYENGLVSKIEERDGSTVITSTTLIRNSAGEVTGIKEIYGGKTITSTFIKDANGQLTSITKEVV